MAEDSKVLFAIFYLIIKGSFYYSQDWLLMADWLLTERLESQVPRRSLSTELVEEIFTAMPHKEMLDMEGIYRLPEICCLVDRYMSTEEQKSFLGFLRRMDARQIQLTIGKEI